MNFSISAVSLLQSPASSAAVCACISGFCASIRSTGSIPSLEKAPCSTRVNTCLKCSSQSLSMSTPSRLSSGSIPVSVREIRVGVTSFPAAKHETISSNKGRYCEYTIISASSLLKFNSAVNRFDFSVSNSGTDIRSKCSFEISAWGTSVSGYILAAPGSGLR